LREVSRKARKQKKNEKKKTSATGNRKKKSVKGSTRPSRERAVRKVPAKLYLRKKVH